MFRKSTFQSIPMTSLPTVLVCTSACCDAVCGMALMSGLSSSVCMTPLNHHQGTPSPSRFVPYPPCLKVSCAWRRDQRTEKKSFSFLEWQSHDTIYYTCIYFGSLKGRYGNPKGTKETVYIRKAVSKNCHEWIWINNNMPCRVWLLNTKLTMKKSFLQWLDLKMTKKIDAALPVYLNLQNISALIVTA